MKKSINKLTCGLFQYRGSAWWRNIKDIKTYIQRVFFTLKHGYSPSLQWETYSWVIEVAKEILEYYKKNRYGTAWLIQEAYEPELEDENIKFVNRLIVKMEDLVDRMDESNPIYEEFTYYEMNKQRNIAKDEFFELVSKYFFAMWD